MKENNKPIMYEEFLRETLKGTIDIHVDNLKAMLVEKSYNPRSSDTFDLIKNFEISCYDENGKSTGYGRRPGGKYITIYDKNADVDKDKIKAEVNWENLYTYKKSNIPEERKKVKIGFLVIYRDSAKDIPIAADPGLILCLCQPIELEDEYAVLSGEDVNIIWDDFYSPFHKFLQDPSISEYIEYSSILGTEFLLGKSKLRRKKYEDFSGDFSSIKSEVLQQRNSLDAIRNDITLLKENDENLENIGDDVKSFNSFDDILKYCISHNKDGQAIGEEGVIYIDQSENVSWHWVNWKPGLDIKETGWQKITVDFEGLVAENSDIDNIFN